MNNPEKMFTQEDADEVLQEAAEQIWWSICFNLGHPGPAHWQELREHKAAMKRVMAKASVA